MRLAGLAHTVIVAQSTGKKDGDRSGDPGPAS